MSSDAKQRILSHMNDSHHLAIVDYVVVYGNQPLATIDADSALLANVDDQYITLTYDLKSGGQKTLELEWNEIEEGQDLRVDSLRDVKDKLIAMAKYAANKQGFSHVQITNYPSLTINTLGMVLLLLAFATGSYDKTLIRRLFTQDALFQKILPYIPSFLGKIYSIGEENVKVVAASTYAIHVAEVLFILRPNQVKYRVPPKQSLAWSLLNLLEGFPLLIQFNKLKPKH